MHTNGVRVNGIRKLIGIWFTGIKVIDGIINLNVKRWILDYFAF